MRERANLVTLNGAPVTLTGHVVKVGDKAPDVELINNEMQSVYLSDFFGKTLVILSVGSLDTAVCDLETRRFNQEAAGLGPDVHILTISMDLPFAQKRWCGAAGVSAVTTLSDYRGADFGDLYGVLIKETHLLARAVFVLDCKAVVRYIQIVPEVASEPDYEAVLREVRTVLAEKA